MHFYLYFNITFISIPWSDFSRSEGSHSYSYDSDSQMSSTLDLVKAPQQIKATLRRLEQVQGPGQNTARLLNRVCVMKCQLSLVLPAYKLSGKSFFFSAAVEE